MPSSENWAEKNIAQVFKSFHLQTKSIQPTEWRLLLVLHCVLGGADLGRFILLGFDQRHFSEAFEPHPECAFEVLEHRRKLNRKLNVI